nr:hypothetical protein [Tanacetum cinerariifolium]
MNDLQFKLDNFQKNQQDFQKKFEQMQHDLLNQMRNFMQNLHDGLPILPPGVEKEHEATKYTELPSTEDIQPLSVQELSQNSDMRQLIRKECCVEVPEKQKKSMEDTMLDALNSKLFLINSNSQRLDKKECDVPISKNSPIFDNHSDTFSDSKIDDDISVYDNDFEDIEYVEASLSNPEIVSIEEENIVQQEEEETRSGNTTHADNSLPEYDSFCFEIEPDKERLINLVKNDIPDNSSNDSLLDEADLFLVSDHSIPSGIENFYDSKGDIRFLEALLLDDSILSYESPDSNFEDNPSIPRPPPEPPDVETDAGEEIPVVTIDKDKFDDDYHFFMFDKVFSLLFAKSEDTIFDPGISN